MQIGGARQWLGLPARSTLGVGGRASACLLAFIAPVFMVAASCHVEGSFPNVRPYCVDGPARVSPIDDRGPTLDELCPAIAVALCAQWARCSCGVREVDVCQAHVLVECETFVDVESVRTAIARGRMGWSGSHARVFLSALESATAGCEPVDLDLSRVGVGRVPDFEPCTQVSGGLTECLSGSACESWFLGGPFGAPVGEYCSQAQELVQQWQRVGERCSVGYAGVCMDGLRCAPVCDSDGTAGICAARLPLGERCVAFLSDCVSGFCELPSRDVGSGREGRCAQSFRLADGEACLWDSSCASHRCTAAIADRGVCAPLLVEGELCWNDWHCVSGRCADDSVLRIQQCRSDSTSCASAADCPGSECVTATPAGRCAPRGAEGEPCAWPLECESGRCNGTACEARIALGARCSGGDCISGACVGGICQLDEQPIGAPCDERALCASRSCVDGSCAPAVCTARVDPTGHGYYRWHPFFLTP